MAEELGHHQRDTLEEIFAHPSSGNVEWRRVRSLLEALDALEARHDGKVAITLGGQHEVIQPPRGKDVDQDLLSDLRRMLRAAGYQPDAG
jgi:hypothetical protein